MNMGELAVGYLKQAEARLSDAKDAAAEGNNAYALRLSQECVELCVKAALRSVAIEYPKQHEVSELLKEFKQRFPPWFASETAFLRDASVSLFKKRALAFYGGEDTALPPDRVISAADSTQAVESGERVFGDCKKLLLSPD